MDLTPTSHLPMQGPRQDSCPAPCSLLNHLGNHITEAILSRLVLTDLRHPGSHISLPLLPPLHLRRIGRHISLPGLLGLYLLVPEEVVSRETTAKPPVRPAVEG